MSEKNIIKIEVAGQVSSGKSAVTNAIVSQFRKLGIEIKTVKVNIRTSCIEHKKLKIQF